MSDTVDERAEQAPESSPAGTPPRGIPPVAIPILALFGMLILVFSISRILLIVSHTQAAIIALFMSMNVLVGAALVAAGRWVRNRPAAFPMIVLGGLLVVAGGAVATAMGAGTIEAPEGIPVPIVAEGIAFLQTDIVVPSDEPLAIEFDNRDPGIPHNVHIGEGEEYPDPSAGGLLVGEIINGPAQITYDLPQGLPEGAYGFICDVHPNMQGTITAEPGAEVGGGEGEPGPGPGESPTPEPTGGESPPPPPPGEDVTTVTAVNLSFQEDEVTVTPVDGQITILFRNADQGVPHNLVVNEGEGADDPAHFEGEIITGPDRIEYTFDALPPGRYFFYCAVHPDMTGTLVVE